MTDTAPVEDTSVLPGLAEMLEAGRLPVTITRAEDLHGDGQMPYAKVNRVPEVALSLEAIVIEALTHGEDRDVTAGMLRMMRARSEVKAGEPSWVVGIFQVLDGEGGRVNGHVAAEMWWAPGARTYDEVSPVYDYDHQAAEDLESAVARYESGWQPAQEDQAPTAQDPNGPDWAPRAVDEVGRGPAV